MRPTINPSLYLVTDKALSLGRPLKEIVSKAVAGGVTMVQLREKDSTTHQFVEEAFIIKKMLKQYDVPLIINDRVDVAMAIDADGIHLGQSDMHWELARKLLGPDKIIGLSIESVDQIDDANQADIDYIGISPVFTTPTKRELQKGLGLIKTSEIAQKSKHPSVAIGGINTENALEIMQTGVDGISVVSAICSASEPETAARKLITIINHNNLCSKD